MGIYIGVTTAATELTDSPINAAITRLAAAAARTNRQHPMPAGPSLDVTFMLPGKLEKPDFSGMRMGGYSPEGNTLFFETAVPEHILKSSHAGRYVATVMEDVLSHAGAFFEDHAMDFDTSYWRRVMDQITDSTPSHR